MSIQTETPVIRQNLITRALWRNRVLITLVLVHLMAALMVSVALGVPFHSGTVPTLLMLLKTLIPLFLVILMFWRFADMVLRIRPDKPTKWFINDVRTNALDPDQLVSGVIAMLCVSLFAGSFAFIKDSIPLMHPFVWDPAFAELDRVLHFGQDPYKLLMPLFGTPLATTFINAAYHFWFFLLYFLIFMTSFDKDCTERRNTFLMAFVLTWAFGGNLLGTVFSSVGPVFYQAFGYGDAFVPLMEKLNEFALVSPVWALDVQHILIDGYQNNGPVRGISAMPSMHVASAALMALYGFAWRRWAGWLLTGFAVLVQIGSVHLAWHYAIDGYLGALIAVVGWYAARWLARRYC